jgi:23S rRNA (guanosine2251-2'-O)-methyltransferase
MAILYGIHAVTESLRADPHRVERICIERGQKNPRIKELVDLARAKGVAVSFEDRTWLDRKAQGGRHQGAVGYVSEMPTVGVEEILARAGSPGLVLLLDGIEDPQNLGAILRSAEVAGADGVIIPQRRSAGLSGSAVKASAGAASHIKVTKSGNAAQLIEQLKKSGYWIAGLDADAPRLIWEVDFTVPTALVLGSEGGGLHRLVKEKCDFLVSIPVRGKIGSLNVSVAAGIALYEIIRQRSQSKKSATNYTNSHEF